LLYEREQEPPLLDTAAGHPQHTMLLAHVLWNLTGECETATEQTWLATYDRVMREVRDELPAVWTGLPPLNGASSRPSQRAAREFTPRVLATAVRGAALRLRRLVDRGEITLDQFTVRAGGSSIRCWLPG
jgi:hypothetical protein